MLLDSVPVPLTAVTEIAIRMHRLRRCAILLARLSEAVRRLFHTSSLHAKSHTQRLEARWPSCGVPKTTRINYDTNYIVQSPLGLRVLISCSSTYNVSQPVLNEGRIRYRHRLDDVRLRILLLLGPSILTLVSERMMHQRGFSWPNWTHTHREVSEDGICEDVGEGVSVKYWLPTVFSVGMSASRAMKLGMYLLMVNHCIEIGSHRLDSPSFSIKRDPHWTCPELHRGKLRAIRALIGCWRLPPK